MSPDNNDDGLDLPAFLQRGSTAAGTVPAAIPTTRAPQASLSNGEHKRTKEELYALTAAKSKAYVLMVEARAAKSRGRIATLKAKQSGETAKMPLCDRDALRFILKGE